jgi:hypothetical protein
VFVLGHVGIGVALASPRLSPDARTLRFLILGTLLPDLVDKPLYYGLVLVTGRMGAQLGLLSSTRTFGHTLVLCLLLYLLLPRRIGTPLAAGMLTHLFLDEMGDLFGFFFPRRGPSVDSPPTAAAILFPLLGPHFPVSPFSSVGEHILTIGETYILTGEAIGALLLYLNRKKLLTALPWLGRT